jgi:hypothetical protein
MRDQRAEGWAALNSDHGRLTFLACSMEKFLVHLLSRMKEIIQQTPLSPLGIQIMPTT